MLEHDFAVRQQAREVDQKPPGRDDRTLTLDLRFDREAQRELHIGGGQLQPSLAAAQENSTEHLDACACRDRSSDNRERAGELVLGAGDLHG